MAPMPPRSPFPWYLGGASLWFAAASLQVFLLQWLFVGELGIRPMDYGLIRAFLETPALALLLVGGVIGDRVDRRRLLVGLSLLACIPPLAIVATADALSFWPLVAFGASLAFLQSLSDPARQSMLSAVAPTDMQRTVTVMTIVTTLTGIGGYWVGGQLEALGLRTVLAIQAACFFASGLAVLRLPPGVGGGVARPGRGLASGFVVLWRLPLLRNVILLNLFSSMFNAGAYLVGMPFIARDIYGGNEAFFALMMMVFTAGTVGCNVVLLALMPLRRPGRAFVAMQLTRIVILVALWLEPPQWLFFVLLAAWGVNMGVTSTVARAMVQELAPAEHRAQVLSVFLFGFMVAAPVSSLVLGAVIDFAGPTTGLLPGVPVSLMLFAGALAAGLWRFESPSAAGRAGGSA
ncbi:MAG: MFS transporter [Gammaproteobacteria bacterium]|nr:MFS transporter [Gammaproteobacteria bacterium]